jgi:hypothetical protein
MTKFLKLLTKFRGQFVIMGGRCIRHKETECCPLLAAAGYADSTRNGDAEKIAVAHGFVKTADAAEVITFAADMCEELADTTKFGRKVRAMRKRLLKVLGLKEPANDG